MPAEAARYLLPCAESFKCFDRFSILDDASSLEDADGQVPFWPVFTTLLTSSIRTPTQLAELLDTIAVTLRDSSGPAGDYGLLKAYISASQPAFFDTLWRVIVELALDLPLHFSDGSIKVLGAEGEREGGSSILTLSRRQTACLVVHQFFCTLRAPTHREDFFDFSIWYASEQRHEYACRIYLNCLFTYLEEFLPDGSENSRDGSSSITYTLVTREPEYEALDLPPVSLGPIEIVVVDKYETSPEQLGLPSGAAVVAANRYIGFGQSATQEEVHVGSSPEACPAVLVTPPLGRNDVLVVRGAKAVLNITGQRRDIEVAAQEAEESADWGLRTMLFMDALELDVEDAEAGLPDLKPENLAREINKAYTAFSSGHYEVIWSPLWGCGAFGGDPFIKVVLLWCAASLAGTPLKILCDRSSRDLAASLDRMVRAVGQRRETARDLIRLLENMPRRIERLKTFDWMIETLEAEDEDV